MSNSSVFKVRLKVLRSSADRHLYDSEFQIEGALTVNAFADNASVIFGTNSNNLSDERNVLITIMISLLVWRRCSGSKRMAVGGV